MKLVEILAKELKEWPEGAACVAQDRSGEVWPFMDTDIEIYKDDGQWGGGICPRHGWDSEVSQLATDHSTAIVTREMWEQERAKGNAEPAEWNGQGMPPVGAVVVTAYRKTPSTVVAQNSDCGEVCIKGADGHFYISPAHAVAPYLDKRAKALRDMNSLYIDGGMAALWDAGYRRVES